MRNSYTIFIFLIEIGKVASLNARSIHIQIFNFIRCHSAFTATSISQVRLKDSHLVTRIPVTKRKTESVCWPREEVSSTVSL